MSNTITPKVEGPVIPLPTPFTKDYKVDYDALASYVDFLVLNGIKNVMTTVGTSRYNLLTDDEIKKVPFSRKAFTDAIYIAPLGWYSF